MKERRNIYIHKREKRERKRFMKERKIFMTDREERERDSRN